MNNKTQPNNKFPKKSHLLKPNQFDGVFTDPNLRFSNNYILLLARQTPLTYSRLGLVVAKKKVPLAVNRNRFKRLTREYFRANKNSMGSFDIVVLCRNDLTTLSKNEQNQNIKQTFERFKKSIHAE